MEDRNWSMYRPKIVMIELWPEKTGGAQDTLYMMYNTWAQYQDQRPTRCREGVKYIAVYVEKYIS